MRVAFVSVLNNSSFLNTRPFLAAAAACNLISLPPAMRKTCPTLKMNCGGCMMNNPFHRLQCNGKHLGQNRGSNPRRACLFSLSIHCSSNKTRVAKLPHGMDFFCFWRQFWVCGAQAFADLQDREATQIEDCGMGDNLHKIHGTQHTLE